MKHEGPPGIPAAFFCSLTARACGPNPPSARKVFQKERLILDGLSSLWHFSAVNIREALFAPAMRRPDAVKGG
jgi:hypothetical protein